jgi:internalin A
LPEWLRELSALEELYLHGNDALGLPPEVLGPSYEELLGTKGAPAKPADILDYYFRTRGGRRPLNEAKLILLGRGEVGKTCLVNRLVHDKFASTFMTRGIAITQWPVTTGKDTVRLHVWDFGGQEIQHATHQFFLTERSLYLVVLNGRAGAEDEDAEYWLKFIKTFGASSPTIVVLNKFKVQPFQVNRRALQEKYPFIRAFVETDCKPKTKNGILELKREIESALATMECVRADFPAGWFQIKERLADMKEPFISFDEYRKICAGLGESDAQAQERLAGFLNALGIALNFREDQQLREETVLNPHWITQGVYQIITSKALAKRQGELRLADLTGILPKQAYPPRMHGFLIELMRKFELCFPYHDDVAGHRYLVPELLGKEQPALKESFPPGECLNFRYDYRLMPEGLLPRFITRTHTMSEPAERWRTGVVLRWEGCRALVKADKQERQVLVRVLGEPEKRRRLLAVIRENFDQIHGEMKEFKPAEWVALNEDPSRWVSCAKLETFERNREHEFKEDLGGRLITVHVIDTLELTDVVNAQVRRERRESAERPLKLFISYAHEDERWRARLAPNLNLLQREGLVEVWCDLQIKAGDKWDDEIKKKLNEADIFLFLMSTDLLASNYVQKVELPIARMRHEGKTACIVPVVVRACSWARYLGDIQGLPRAGRPVREWRDKDQAFHDVETGLRQTVLQVRKMLGCS